MTIRVGMYEGSHAHIRDRLDDLKLDLDLDVVVFDREGRFDVDGALTAPEDVSLDYLWLSTHLVADDAQKAAFDVALRLKSLAVLQTFNAGLDNPIYRRIAERGVRLCNSSAQGVAIAEYVFAQILSVFHPIEEQRTMQAAREWRVTPFREISQTRWVIAGFGPIGRATAARAKAFGAHVTALRRSTERDPSVDRMGVLDDLPEVLPEADVILLACPLTEATRDLAGPAFFEATKPGAILVNIARGGVVDDAALIAALDAERLGAAVLDVFRTEPLPADDPLWSHPKVRVTPHTSFAGDGSRGRWDA
ncbi:MAG: NAD(P)-dependent oxidoreductase, partial [Pseudomonadota bacterium]